MTSVILVMQVSEDVPATFGAELRSAEEDTSNKPVIDTKERGLRGSIPDVRAFGLRSCSFNFTFSQFAVCRGFLTLQFSGSEVAMHMS